MKVFLAILTSSALAFVMGWVLCIQNQVKPLPEAKNEAIETAGRKDRDAAQAKQNAKQAEALTLDAKRHLASIRAQSAQPTATARISADAGIVEPLDILKAQDAVIIAQDAQIQALKIQVSALEKARDEWQRAFEIERRNREAQRIAFESKLAAERANKWKWGIVGFAAGVGTGYIGGKIQ